MSAKIIDPKRSGHYCMPTKAWFGRGSLSTLTDIARSQNIGLVCGRHFKNSQLFDYVITTLLRGCAVHVYSVDITRSDPDTIDNLAVFCRQSNCDMIVAIGGGAILDSAKCAAILSPGGGSVADYVASQDQAISRAGIPLVAIPTTAGTGSEVTPWATIWSDHKKLSMSSEFMFPKFALIDPVLTDSLPPIETAHSGVDALTQAVEAYWSKQANSVSDDYALESIRTIINSLETAVTQPTIETRDKMAWGALLGGLAFSNTQTTICHAVSYPLTAHWGVAHGQAVAITLPLFIEYVIPAMPPERRLALLSAFGTDTEHQLAKLIRSLIIKIGLVARLSDLGVGEDKLGMIATESLASDRAHNTPRVPTHEELVKLLKSIL